VSIGIGAVGSSRARRASLAVGATLTLLTFLLLTISASRGPIALVLPGAGGVVSGPVRASVVAPIRSRGGRFAAARSTVVALVSSILDVLLVVLLGVGLALGPVFALPGFAAIITPARAGI